MALYRHGSLILFFGVLALAGLAQQQDGQAYANRRLGDAHLERHSNRLQANRMRSGSEKSCAFGRLSRQHGYNPLRILLPDGKSLVFDEGGDAKAVDALRRSRKGSKVVFDYWRAGKTAGVVKARVTGTQTSDTLNVESVTVL